MSTIAASADTELLSAVVEKLPLRERKKAKTRAQILQIAERMFLKHGFDAVPLESIADECDVSVRTVLRYFETKEELALAPFYEQLETFQDALANRDTDVLTFWRDWVATNAKRMAENPNWFRRHAEMAAKHPQLYARGAAINHLYEDLLADAIADEQQDDGLGPRLLAATLVAGNAAVARHWLASKGPFDTDTFVEVVDYAADAFGGKFVPGSRRSRSRRA